MSFGARAQNRRSRSGPKRPRPVTADRLERIALFYLGRYASSAENLRRVLTRRLRRAELAPDDPAYRTAQGWIDALIERLTASGILNDRAYAEAQTASLHRRGVARRRIGQRLGARGVARDEVAQALSNLDESHGGDSADATDQRAALASARRKRLGPFRPAAERKARRDRDLAALARAGFAFDLARRVIDAPDVDELEAEILGTERGEKKR
jgi:regulatory protein